MALGNTNKSKKSIFTEWLEQLQQESWQLELLISGLALFGIWESRGLLQRLEYYVDVNVTSTYEIYVDSLINVFWGGWAIFMCNLLIHIIVRALWIGAIGLRYVSGDIDFDELNYSEVFRRYFKKKIGGFDEYIERLEKLSSVIFSFTFLLFLLLFSFVFANLVFGVLVTLIRNLTGAESVDGPTGAVLVFGFIFYGLGLLVFIDFITLGAFKKVKDKTFSRTYFVIYRFFSFISLSTIYRPLLLNFIDDKYTRRLFFLAIPYMILVLFGVNRISFERYSHMPSFNSNHDFSRYIDQVSIDWHIYDDEREAHYRTFASDNDQADKRRIRAYSLDKYEQDGAYAKLFLTYQSADSELLARQNPDFSPFRKNGLRHSIFSRGHVEDAIEKELESKEAAEARIMTRVVRNQMDDLSDEDKNAYPELVTYYEKYNEEDRSDLLETIRDAYSAQRRELFKEKLQSSVDQILANYKIWVDEKSYIDSLECSYYTHPNLHERGLLCYFPLSNLDSGSHMIRLDKKYDRDECIEDCPTWTAYIPFRKI